MTVEFRKKLIRKDLSHVKTADELPTGVAAQEVERGRKRRIQGR